MKTKIKQLFKQDLHIELHKKMNSLSRSKPNNKVDNDGTNCEKVFKVSKIRRKARLNNSSIWRRCLISSTSQYNASFFVIQIILFIFFCDVFMRPCSSQLDLGMI